MPKFNDPSIAASILSPIIITSFFFALATNKARSNILEFVFFTLTDFDVIT